MRITERVRTIFLCLVLEVGALAGVPMRPEQIGELLGAMNQPKQAQVIPLDDEESEGK